MKKLFCIMVVLVFVSISHAQQDILRVVPPTTNDDGTELTDLAGYRFRCNDKTYTVNDPAQLTVELCEVAKNLTGDFKCYVLAFDTSGNKSIEIPIGGVDAINKDCLPPAGCKGLILETVN